MFDREPESKWRETLSKEVSAFAFNVEALPDHEIRLRMNRGKITRATIRARVRAVTLGTGQQGERLAEIRDQEESLDAVEQIKEAAGNAGIELGDDSIDTVKKRAQLNEARDIARNFPDIISFDLVLRNDGELTIRDPAIEARASFKTGRGWGLAKTLFGADPAWGFPKESALSGDQRPCRFEMRGMVLYPGDERAIVNSGSQIVRNRNVAMSEGDLVVLWKVLLDNSPPSTGETDMGSEIEAVRREQLDG